MLLELLGERDLFDAFCPACVPSRTLRLCVESDIADILSRLDDFLEYTDPVGNVQSIRQPSIPVFLCTYVHLRQIDGFELCKQMKNNQHLVHLSLGLLLASRSLLNIAIMTTYCKFPQALSPVHRRFIHSCYSSTSEFTSHAVLIIHLFFKRQKQDLP